MGRKWEGGKWMKGRTTFNIHPIALRLVGGRKTIEEEGIGREGTKGKLAR